MTMIRVVSSILVTLLVIATVLSHDVPSLTLGISHQTTFEDMLAHHDKVNFQMAHEKHFKSGSTLAYVTPWNNRGYDIAKQFKGKFDYVSPVWYYIERKLAATFDIIGEHDVDQQWMSQVRGQVDGRAVGKIVPRFQIRNWKYQDYNGFLSSTKEARVLSREILHQVNKYDFDGIVLECGVPMAFYGFIQQLANDLHKAGKELIVVLPAHHERMDPSMRMTTDMFAAMAKFVDRFSLMTYDFSSHNPQGGPASPLDWIMDHIEQLTTPANRHQLLVGISLYAMSYVPTRYPEPLVLRQVLDILQLQDPKKTELRWDKESQEHWFKYTGTNKRTDATVWLPTLKSIQQRITVAKEYGVGISLWEVGQGLDYFYELF